MSNSSSPNNPTSRRSTASPGKAHRVAIVAWQSMPAVFGSGAKGVGGLETAAWTFAKGLAARTVWQPTLVFRSSARIPQSQVDGVDLHADIDRWESVRRSVSSHVDLKHRRLRHFSPHLFWQVPALAATWPFRRRDPELMGVDGRLMPLNPDVWVTMGVGKESAGVIATAAAQGRPSVLMLQSGADLDARYAENKITRSAYGERSDVCRFAIEKADEIVCQTDVQRERLQKLFGRDGSLIRNSLDIDRWQIERCKHDRRHVLWIGRYEEFAKRIQLAIQIAQACPEVPIRMIVNPDDLDVEKRVRSSLPKNIELVDYVRFDEMPLQYAQSTAFLSTSSAAAEGFPNVLLQAAASGTPIVTLQDFDRFFEKSGAGIVCNDDIQLASKMLSEFQSGKRSHAVETVDEYLFDNHSFDRVTDQLANLLNAVLNRFTQRAVS